MEFRLLSMGGSGANAFVGNEKLVARDGARRARFRRICAATASLVSRRGLAGELAMLCSSGDRAGLLDVRRVRCSPLLQSHVSTPFWFETVPAPAHGSASVGFWFSVPSTRQQEAHDREQTPALLNVAAQDVQLRE